MPPRSKLSSWLARYGVAEVVGTATAVAGAWALRALTGNVVLAAYGGAIGENIGYYGALALRDLGRARRVARASGLAFGAREAALVGRELASEFALAELLDTGILRPLLMGLGARWLGDDVGVVAGKLAADLAFYTVVIGSLELRPHARRCIARWATPRG